MDDIKIHYLYIVFRAIYGYQYLTQLTQEQQLKIREILGWIKTTNPKYTEISIEDARFMYHIIHNYRPANMGSSAAIKFGIVESDLEVILGLDNDDDDSDL